MSYSALLAAFGMLATFGPDAAPAGPFQPSNTTGEPQARTLPAPLIVEKPKYKIVCGTVVFQADPRIDPKIRIPIPNRDVQYAIRRVPRRECR